MRRRTAVVVVALAALAAAAIAACTLNPQPLPPQDFSAGENSDASADGGRFSPVPTADAGVGSADGDAGDAGDAADAADAADASDGG